LKSIIYGTVNLEENTIKNILKNGLTIECELLNVEIHGHSGEYREIKEKKRQKIFLYPKICPAIKNSGWQILNKSENSSVDFKNGEVLLRVYKCNYVKVKYTKPIKGDIEISFDYITKSDEWYEIPKYYLYVDGKLELEKGLKIKEHGEIKSSEKITTHASNGVEIIFEITPSAWCKDLDHKNTYLIIKNLKVRKIN
jgi:hypothetical protein